VHVVGFYYNHLRNAGRMGWVYGWRGYITKGLLSVQKHLSLTFHATEICNCSGGLCFWGRRFSLTSHAIQQILSLIPCVTFFFPLSPLSHPTSFKMREFGRGPLPDSGLSAVATNDSPLNAESFQ
jgi:hypothetical protein